MMWSRFSGNEIGTLNLLKVVRRCFGVKVIVVPTGDKCYENLQLSRGDVEAHPLCVHDPCSSSKACAESMTAPYQRWLFGRGAAIASARADDIKGGGDRAKGRRLPDMVRAFSAGQPVRLRNPDATHPWQRILDSFAGYLDREEYLVAEVAAFDGAWKLGAESSDAVPVTTVVELVVGRWCGPGRWKREGASQPNEAKVLVLDAAHVRATVARELPIRQFHHHAEAVSS